jgi:hypothetical protein
MLERAVYLFSTTRMMSNIAFKAGSSKQGKTFKLHQLWFLMEIFGQKELKFTFLASIGSICVAAIVFLVPSKAV